VDSREIWKLLKQGGARPPSGVGPTGAASAFKYNAFCDPAGAEKLGKALAALTRGVAPTLVVVWEEVEDVVLGHIVARELGVPLIRIYNAEGLAASSSPIPDGAAGLLVSDVLRDTRPVRAAEALLVRAGGRLLAVAVLVSSDSMASIPSHSLVRPEERSQ